MSGHSHWAGIKHKKGIVDAKKGKVFSKVAKQITIAARRGGGDLNANLTLKYAVEKARSVNMSKDSIERAIKKGTGEIAGEELVQIVYEGFGPGGVAILVDCLTDNRNRTAGEIRKLFDSHGGRLAGVGQVAWMFSQKGLISVDAAAASEDDLMEIALDASAEDMERVGSSYELTCLPAAFERLKAGLAAGRIPMGVCEITMIPQNVVELDEDSGRKVLSLMEKLEDHDDVQNVYANFKLPEAMLIEHTS
ncbi:MAG: YebC/PmpR family DNA-binding transcriptional regulator [Planctomycetota bacterium]